MTDPDTGEDVRAVFLAAVDAPPPNRISGSVLAAAGRQEEIRRVRRRVIVQVAASVLLLLGVGMAGSIVVTKVQDAGGIVSNEQIPQGDSLPVPVRPVPPDVPAQRAYPRALAMMAVLQRAASDVGAEVKAGDAGPRADVADGRPQVDFDIGVGPFTGALQLRSVPAVEDGACAPPDCHVLDGVRVGHAPAGTTATLTDQSTTYRLTIAASARYTAGSAALTTSPLSDEELAALLQRVVAVP